MIILQKRQRPKYRDCEKGGANIHPIATGATFLSKHRQHTAAWIHLDLAPVRNGGSDVLVKTGEHRQTGERRALHHETIQLPIVLILS
jgi:hypothetical protein